MFSRRLMNKKVQNSPMDEGSFGEHEVELVIEPGPRLHDRGGVGETADGARDFG
jgi:hypothetical protein